MSNLDLAAKIPKEFCGCCGRPIKYGEWCSDCAKHLSPNDRLPPWDRTWFGQHKTDCPFEKKYKPVPSTGGK